MTTLCVSPRPDRLQYPQSLEPRPNQVSRTSPSDTCSYNPFFRLRTSTERERFRRERYQSIASGPIQDLIYQSVVNFRKVRPNSINQRTVGFSFLSHAIYGDIKPHTFVSWPVDGINRQIQEFTQSKEIKESQDLFIIDNDSTFLPKPVKRVHLKIKSIRTGLPFEGDSQIFLDR